MKIYLDVSCLNRPFDDQNQTRIRLESAAITTILENFDLKHWDSVASEMVEIEVNAIPNPFRRAQVKLLLPKTEQLAKLTEAMFERARQLEGMGFKPADAVHISAAEQTGADVFLSCDDRLLRTAHRNNKKIKVAVANPLRWLEEIENDQNS